MMKSAQLAYQGQVFTVEFYQAENGALPAQTWLESQSLKQQQKFAALFMLLADTGKIWNERKFKHLSDSDQIFEFKADQGRMFCFFFVGQRVILTHGFIKKSQKTPKREILKAEDYKADFLARSKK